MQGRATRPALPWLQRQEPCEASHRAAGQQRAELGLGSPMSALEADPVARIAGPPTAFRR
jgi:hypothetical protein